MIFGFGTLSLACPGLTMRSCAAAIAVVSRLTEGKAPPCHYNVNGHEYNMGYYLVDGIYPPWATFVSTISNPVGQKKAHSAQRQEPARKDIERAFGVLQAHYAVVRGRAKQVGSGDLVGGDDMLCDQLIMHNMTVEDERDDDVATLEFENIGDHIQLPDQNPAHLKSLFKCINKFNIDQLTSS